LLTICSIGCFTSLFGSIMAMFQSHMKRIIAYSTTSQLGYMMFSCALGNYFGIVFHLFIHAFFKSLLFLTAGHIIHININESHIIKLSSFINVLPVSYNLVLIGSLCLTSWPNISGYYSKEYIISSSYYLWSDLFLYYICIFAIHCTLYYSTKIGYMQFSILLINI
jgi:NADH:ubiquinone oxidoreductase subunit 5 (subunit L)/multisubunit Na+/H+ antiporter MnhA subunit